MKNRSPKTILLAGSATFIILSASPAIAEQAQPQDTGEIIVTARRVEEKLQDVPISMQVFKQEDLAKRDITIAADLATYTPSLALNNRFGPEKSSFSIRGFNQEQGTSPTVGVYFADVVGVRAQGGTTSGNTVGAGSFTDLQNVQVLKGPQGTLFGRNTTGGAILLVPVKPTDRLEGYVQGTLGNYNQRRIEAALNVPLADTFKVRLSVDRNKRDGYMRNHAATGPKAYNDTNYIYGRLSIVADLTPNLENYTVATYSRSDTNGYATRLAVCDRNPIQFDSTASDYLVTKDPTNPNFDFLRVVQSTSACAQIESQAARGDGPYDVSVNDSNPYQRITTWQIINTTTWQASDNLTVKNILSYGEYREDADFPLNSDNFTVQPLPFPLQDQLVASQGLPYYTVRLVSTPAASAASESTITEELQLQGQAMEGRLKYVVGGYLEFSRPVGSSGGRIGVYGQCDDPVNLQCSAPLGFAIIAQPSSRISFDNHGIFAQGTFNLTDQLALTLGGRYTFDKTTGISQGTTYTFAPIPDLGVAIVSQTCSDTVTHPGVNIGPAAFGGDGSGDISKCRVRKGTKSSAPTWLVGLDYKPSPDLLVYGKWSRGYRQGGLSFVNPGIETWDPERVDAFEVGMKTSFRGAVSGNFNVAAFYNNLSGQQTFGGLIAKPNDVGLTGGAGILNVGKSRIYGVEVNALANFFDSLTFDLAYTYLNTKIKELAVPDLTNTPFLNFSPTANEGDPLIFSPKHRLSLTGTYILPLDESLGRVSVGATMTHTAKQLANKASPFPVLPSSTLLNLNLGWDGVLGTPVDLSVFATNVTNKAYLVNVGGNYESFGFDNFIYGQPRIVGVRLRYNFGR